MKFHLMSSERNCRNGSLRMLLQDPTEVSFLAKTKRLGSLAGEDRQTFQFAVLHGMDILQFKVEDHQLSTSFLCGIVCVAILPA
jgi:hypothetical protein